MKIVIQCAATKVALPANAGFRTTDNRHVKFIAHPELAPPSDTVLYAHPDDLSEDGRTWRERVLAGNSGTGTNEVGLVRAYELYANRAYSGLTEKFGVENVFILSAGWGLISTCFLIPDYDITFSTAKNVERHCRRSKRDRFADMNQLPDDGESVIFLGGKDYLPLFCELTEGLRGVKKIFYNSLASPIVGHGFHAERFNTTQRTNWHYPCAQALIGGQIGD